MYKILKKYHIDKSATRAQKYHLQQIKESIPIKYMRLVISHKGWPLEMEPRMCQTIINEKD